MKTPMSSDTKLTKDEECESIDSTKYQGKTCSLFYLTASRPDIMFKVCLCAWKRISKKRTKSKPKRQNRARERKESERKVKSKPKSKSQPKSTPTKSKSKAEPISKKC
ncbi:hypothetical protein Tco_1187462 [Tanacetum coccineum]